MTTHNITENNLAVENEISLKEIIKEFRSWKRLFVKNLKKIFLVGLVGGLIGFAYAYFSKPIYNVKLTFVMRADANSSAISGLAGLSSLLGVGTSAATTSPLDRIVELLGSERIIGQALLTLVSVDGKKDLLINHYLNRKEINDEWGKDLLIRNVNFEIGNEYDKLSLDQRKAIKIISEQIKGKNGIMSKSFDKKSGVISISIVDTNENLSIAIIKTVYDVLVKFYTSEAISTIASKVNILEQKVDSIQNALSQTQRASAISNDQGLGLLLQQDKIVQKKMNFKENVLSVMYGESLKNLEQLNFILATTSPSFSIIDEPYSPIRPYKRSKIIFGTISFFVFAFFYFALIICNIKFNKLLS